MSENASPEWLCRATQKGHDVCGLLRMETDDGGERCFVLLAGSRLCAEKRLSSLREEVLAKRRAWVRAGILVEHEDYALLTRDRFVAPSMVRCIVAGRDSVYSRRRLVDASRWSGRMSRGGMAKPVRLWSWMASHELRRTLAEIFDIPPRRCVRGFYMGRATSYLSMGSAYDLVPVLSTWWEDCVPALDVEGDEAPCECAPVGCCLS